MSFDIWTIPFETGVICWKDMSWNFPIGMHWIYGYIKLKIIA
jgi:hypothetical protein